VGRLSSEKGVRTLLESWRFLERIPLKIIGDGPLMDQVRSCVDTYALDIELLGQKPYEQVIGAVKAAYCLVFPSQWYETFGRVAVEAFACGVPVIASRLGAMAEIVEDRRTGLHFTPGDASDLAATVEWAWQHPDAMAEMGRAARREYETKYTAERNYQLLMTIYEATLAPSR
jgi:glycosyltransferase involved in cell wall biosynthesis